MIQALKNIPCSDRNRGYFSVLLIVILILLLILILLIVLLILIVLIVLLVHLVLILIIVFHFCSPFLLGYKNSIRRNRQKYSRRIRKACIYIRPVL